MKDFTMCNSGIQVCVCVSRLNDKFHDTTTSLVNHDHIVMRILVCNLFCGKSIQKPRNDLQQLFQMIDLDQSGTIEVAEFIGPLSRWAHDSKTAPRFIKYNMLQTMHLQEDLYDLSVDCFRQLSVRVDELTHQIATLTMLNHSLSLGSGGVHGHGPPDSGQESLNQSSSLGLWTRQNTAQEQSPTQSNTTTQEQIDQPPASVDAELFHPKSQKETSETAETRETRDAYLESLLESSVIKLEAKLDLLLERSRMKAPGPIPDVGLGSGGMDSWKAEAGLQSTGLRSRKKPKMLHPEAFRSERCFDVSMFLQFVSCLQLNDAECRDTSC